MLLKLTETFCKHGSDTDFYYECGLSRRVKRMMMKTNLAKTNQIIQCLLSELVNTQVFDVTGPVSKPSAAKCLLLLVVLHMATGGQCVPWCLT